MLFWHSMSIGQERISLCMRTRVILHLMWHQHSIHIEHHEHCDNYKFYYVIRLMLSDDLLTYANGVFNLYANHFRTIVMWSAWSMKPNIFSIFYNYLKYLGLMHLAVYKNSLKWRKYKRDFPHYAEQILLTKVIR